MEKDENCLKRTSALPDDRQGAGKKESNKGEKLFIGCYDAQRVHAGQ